MRLSWRCAALCLILCATTAATRPYQVDDLVKLEDSGPSGLDPSGRWWIVETQRPHDQAVAFTSQGFNAYTLGRPLMVDLHHPAAARPLLPDTPDTAYRVGPYSPGGRFVVVYRSGATRWEAGVVTLATGSVRWLGIGPEQPFFGAGLQWRNETELVAIALPADELPIYRRRDRLQGQRLPDLWARAVKGEQATVTIIGSGRYLEDRPPAVDKRLVRVDVLTGAVTTLDTGPFNDLAISPTGRYVAVLALGAAYQPNATLPARQGELEGRRLSLRIVDLDHGQVTRPLPDRDVLWNLLRWAPRKDELLVFSRAPGEDWPRGRLQRIDADGNAMTLATTLRPVLDWTPYLQIPGLQAAWRGDTPLVRARAGDDRPNGRVDWYALDAAGPTNLTAALPTGVSGAYAVLDQDLIVGAGSDVWRVRSTGRATRVATGARMVVAPQLAASSRETGNPPLNLRARDLWLQVDRPDRRSFAPFAATLLDGQATPLAEQEQVLTVRDHAAVVARTDAHGVQTLTLRRLRSPDLLLHTLNARLADLALPTVQPVRHPGLKGATLTSWLYLPPDHRPGERLPLIVITYPGLAYDTEPYSGRPNAKVFAESTAVLVGHGYAVLMASYARPDDSREPGEGFTEALVAAADAAIATGQVDGDRMALWGHSFGGYASLVAATRTHRFKAIVAANGIADLTSLVLGFMPHYAVAPEDGAASAGLFGWGETSQGQLATTPWDDPQRFVRNSPVYQAGQITTPILLVNSDMDALPIDQGQEMFSALWRQAKDAKLLTFWGEGHVAESPANIRAFYNEAFGFLRPLIGEGRPTAMRPPP